MPVIVNQLELVPEPPPPAESGAATPARSGPVAPTTQDVADVVRHLAERRDRVRAD